VLAFQVSLSANWGAEAQSLAQASQLRVALHLERDAPAAQNSTLPGMSLMAALGVAMIACGGIKDSEA
jgi:hypothetical protein